MWVSLNKPQLIHKSKIKITMKKIKGDYVILAYPECFSSKKAVLLYKKRWSIESMFKALDLFRNSLN
ncbi:hypothetical protein Sarmat_00525 [Rickettsiales endosymbiont of Paramecium tredecaurelia]|nr:hypothetical protein [Candidatus Sarmatiella mevalonica]MBL3284586.1 hypothetical protein [Candidatus Sarmatiella mevalonica]MBL3284674.1 hypothetical protein [Candidatus Sarmatiella mevalonica]